MATPSSGPSLLSIGAVFIKDANLTFGGGSATAETLRRELVVRRGWLSEGHFRLAYAASRLTPATNLLAICTGLGSQLRGIRGAAVALLAASIPSAVVVAMLMAFYAQARSGGVAAATRGAVAVSVALLLSSVWSLARPHVGVSPIRSLLLVVGAWTAYTVFGWSTVAVLTVAATAGSVWPEQAP